jgi:hypothetical protein
LIRHVVDHEVPHRQQRILSDHCEHSVSSQVDCNKAGRRTWVPIIGHAHGQDHLHPPTLPDDILCWGIIVREQPG